MAIHRNLLIGMFLTAFCLAQNQQGAAPQPQGTVSSSPSDNAGKKVADSGSAKSTHLAVQLKNTVAFITTYCEDGNQIIKSQGTAFFVFYADGRLTEGRGFNYLVTNRHIVEPEKQGHKLHVVGMTIRLNLRNAVGNLQSEEGQIRLDGQQHWYFPEDDAVDLAVMPFAPDKDKYEYMEIPVDFLATKNVLSSKDIGEGDPVVFAGFFYQYPGQKKIQPIVRQDC